MAVNNLNPEGVAPRVRVVYCHKARSYNVISDIFSNFIGCYHALHYVAMPNSYI